VGRRPRRARKPSRSADAGRTERGGLENRAVGVTQGGWRSERTCGVRERDSRPRNPQMGRFAEPETQDRRGGAAGGRGSTRPAPRLRVGSQGGMPTRSPPEAGLAGGELMKSPCVGNLILTHAQPPCQYRDAGMYWPDSQYRCPFRDSVAPASADPAAPGGGCRRAGSSGPRSGCQGAPAPRTRSATPRHVTPSPPRSSPRRSRGRPGRPPPPR
jgi:hypothetical protein